MKQENLDELRNIYLGLVTGGEGPEVLSEGFGPFWSQAEKDNISRNMRQGRDPQLVEKSTKPTELQKALKEPVSGYDPNKGTTQFGDLLRLGRGVYTPHILAPLTIGGEKMMGAIEPGKRYTWARLANTDPVYLKSLKRYNALKAAQIDADARRFETEKDRLKTVGNKTETAAQIDARVAALNAKKEPPTAGTTTPAASSTASRPATTTASRPATTPEKPMGGDPMDQWTRANPTLAAKVKPGQSGYNIIKARLDADNDRQENYDAYDLVLSHLINEGYADTQEAALAIMGNMSEDWRESIILEQTLPSNYTDYKAPAVQASHARSMGDASRMRQRGMNATSVDPEDDAQSNLNDVTSSSGVAKPLSGTTIRSGAGKGFKAGDPGIIIRPNN